MHARYQDSLFLTLIYKYKIKNKNKVVELHAAFRNNKAHTVTMLWRALQWLRNAAVRLTYRRYCSQRFEGRPPNALFFARGLMK